MNSSAIALFFVYMAITLSLTYLASRRTKTASDHYVAGGAIGGLQNGLAITGDFVSAAAFLGMSGAIALQGFDGYYIMLGVPPAFVILLFLLAEPLRNLGRFTLADVVTARFNRPRLRAMAAITTLVISVFYMVAQFVGAGILIQLLFGIDYNVAVVAIGIFLIIYVVFGGMLGTTWIQAFQGGLLLLTAVGLVVLAMKYMGYNPLAFFATVAKQTGMSSLEPTRAPSILHGLDRISICLATALGIAGLPHLLIRFLTARDKFAARSSALSASIFVGLFGIALPFIGHAAAVLIGHQAIIDANAGGNLAALQLANFLGGQFALGFVTTTAFIVIVATLSGLAIACSGAFANDLYAHVLKRGVVSEITQLRVARLAALLISVLSLVISLGAQDMNLGFLITLGLCLAASVNLPVLLFTIYWKGLTEVASTYGMLLNLIITFVAVMLSPSVMGEHALIPLSNPALITIPIGFALIWVLSRLTRNSRLSEDSFDEITMRSVLGYQSDRPLSG